MQNDPNRKLFKLSVRCGILGCILFQNSIHKRRFVGLLIQSVKRYKNPLYSLGVVNNYNWQQCLKQQKITTIKIVSLEGTMDNRESEFSMLTRTGRNEVIIKWLINHRSMLSNFLFHRDLRSALPSVRSNIIGL